MKQLLSIFAVALLLVACGSSNQNSKKQAQNKVPANPTDYGNSITSEELKEMLYIYASDEFEGRETGEPGQKKAVNYLKEQYMKMGIVSPLSGDDYFQEVPLQKQKSPEVTLEANGKSYEHYKDFLSLGAAQTELIKSSEIVYVGHGIDAENYSDYAGIDVKGKIVLAKTGEPKDDNGNYITSGTSEETKWSSGRQSLSSKSNAAKDKGAKAMFYVEPALFERYATYYKTVAESGQSWSNLA